MTEGINKFEVLGRIGRGGMGEVLLARPVGSVLDRLVVKTMLPHLSRDRENIDMFLDEARIGGLLNHPNIVQVLDLGRSDETYFMVMEFVDGPHLGQVLAGPKRGRPPLPISLCAHVIARAAEGLHAAHELVHPETHEHLGLVHRDVNPPNILLSFAGQVKLTDFGVVRSRMNRSCTVTGQLKGKLTYMSPEQCLGEGLDHRSDVFSVGIVLYELLARRRLFAGGSDYVVMQRIVKEEPESLSTINPEIDPDLEGIVRRALTKSRDERFATAAELAMALDDWSTKQDRDDLGRWLQEHYGHLRAELRMENAKRIDEQELTRPIEDVRQLSGLAERVRAPVDAIELSDFDREIPTVVTTGPALDTPTPRFTNLTQTGTSFVGRTKDLERLDNLVESGAKVITIVGPGGTGKTRLARQFALQNLDHWSGAGRQSWFCDLSEAHDAESICSAIARVLAVPLGQDPDDLVERLGAAIDARGSIVLILDNFEQAVAHAATTLERFTTLAEGACFIVTSRERTRIPSETVLDLLPLSTNAERAEAAQLFLLRARSAAPGFELAEEENKTVLQIVRRLDGIPLAIELAAARVAVMTPKQILARLTNSFDILGSSSDQTTGRHATLKQTFEWSWQLLSDRERAALAQCSVFAGSFDAEAAEAVVDLSAYPGAETIDLLQKLREKSLLCASRDAAVRFSLYETIREYASRQLPEGLFQNIRAQHAKHYASCAAEWLENRVLPAILIDAENLSDALQYSLTLDQPNPIPTMQIACALSAIRPSLGAFTSHLTQLEEMLPGERVATWAEYSHELTGEVLLARARTALVAGHALKAQSDLAQATLLAERYEDPRLSAAVHQELGNIRRIEGRLSDAEQHHARAYHEATLANDLGIRAAALLRSANTHADRGNHEAAKRFFEKALQIATHIGEENLHGEILGNLGIAHLDAGDFANAEICLRRAVAIHRREGDKHFAGIASGLLGTIAYLKHDYDRAYEMFERSSSDLRSIGEVRFSSVYLGALAAIDCRHDRIDKARAAFLLAEKSLRKLGDLPFLTAVELLSGHLDIALARNEPDETLRIAHQTAAQERVSKLQQRLAAEPDLPKERSEEDESVRDLLANSQAVRFAMMTLQMALAEL